MWVEDDEAGFGVEAGRPQLCTEVFNAGVQAGRTRRTSKGS